MNALSYFSDNYSKDLLLASTVAVILVALSQYRRQPELRIFLYYTLFSFLTDLTDLYRVLTGVNGRVPILLQVWSNVLFIFFEFLVFMYFIFRQLSGRGRRRTIKVLTVVYLTYLLGTMFIAHRFIVYQRFYFMESISLTIASLLYFYELFTQTPESPLKTQPAFWIITGVLVVNCCSLPLYMTMGMLGKYNDISYNLIYLLYAVFYSLMMRAYLCQPRSVLNRRVFLLFKG